MIALNKDEREHKIESISERNAAWVMSIILALGIMYQGIMSALTQEIRMDWILVIALFAGMIVKSVSNLILERRAM